MYLVLKSKNGTELERFRTKELADSVCEHHKKRFPNACVQKEIKVIDVKFEGIDDWSRPVFKDVNSSTRYGDVNNLWTYQEWKDHNALEQYKENPNHNLCYFGHEFNCEPMGGMPTHYRLNIL